MSAIEEVELIGGPYCGCIAKYDPGSGQLEVPGALRLLTSNDTLVTNHVFGRKYLYEPTGERSRKRAPSGLPLWIVSGMQLGPLRDTRDLKED